MKKVRSLSKEKIDEISALIGASCWDYPYEDGEGGLKPFFPSKQAMTEYMKSFVIAGVESGTFYSTDNGEGYILEPRGADPLFFPLDHPMIKAMLKAYYEVTDSDLQPLTIGGGTYAREMANIVAFGCDTQEYKWHIHDDNEFVTLKSLQTQTEVYANALLNLLEI